MRVVKGLTDLQTFPEWLTEVLGDLVHTDAAHGSDCQSSDQGIGVLTILMYGNNSKVEREGKISKRKERRGKRDGEGGLGERERKDEKASEIGENGREREGEREGRGRERGGERG